MHTHTNIYLYRELQDHLVLDFLGFQIYLVRKSISAQKASTDGNGLERELPLLCSLFLKYLQICVRLLTTALIFCSVRFGECWKFLVGAQITHYEAYLVSYGKRKMQSCCMDTVRQYLKLFTSSFICTGTQIWLQITLLRVLIILSANENVHILHTLFADEIFWTLNSSGTDGEHMPSQFVWRAQPRVLPGRGN